MRIQPINNRMPVYHPQQIQPTATAPVAISPAAIDKVGKAEIPFGLTTISFGHLADKPKFATPITRPHPNVGNRMDYYA